MKLDLQYLTNKRYKSYLVEKEFIVVPVYFLPASQVMRVGLGDLESGIECSDETFLALLSQGMFATTSRPANLAYTHDLSKYVLVANTNPTNPKYKGRSGILAKYEADQLVPVTIMKNGEGFLVEVKGSGTYNGTHVPEAGSLMLGGIKEAESLQAVHLYNPAAQHPDYTFSIATFVDLESGRTQHIRAIKNVYRPSYVGGPFVELPGSMKIEVHRRLITDFIEYLSFERPYLTKNHWLDNYLFPNPDDIHSLHRVDFMEIEPLDEILTPLFDIEITVGIIVDKARASLGEREILELFLQNYLTLAKIQDCEREISDRGRDVRDVIFKALKPFCIDKLLKMREIKGFKYSQALKERVLEEDKTNWSLGYFLRDELEIIEYMQAAGRAGSDCLEKLAMMSCLVTFQEKLHLIAQSLLHKGIKRGLPRNQKDFTRWLNSLIVTEDNFLSFERNDMVLMREDAVLEVFFAIFAEPTPQA